MEKGTCIGKSVNAFFKQLGQTKPTSWISSISLTPWEKNYWPASTLLSGFSTPIQVLHNGWSPSQPDPDRIVFLPGMPPFKAKHFCLATWGNSATSRRTCSKKGPFASTGHLLGHRDLIAVVIGAAFDNHALAAAQINPFGLQKAAPIVLVSVAEPQK